MAPASLLAQLFVVTLAMRGCAAATFYLQNDSSTALQHSLPHATPCSFMGRAIISSEYLVGLPGIPGSIYGECRDGQLICHQEPAAHSLNASVVEVKCPSQVAQRSLASMVTADEICKVHGKRITGRQYLHGAQPRTPGSYFAVCDESTEIPRLTCFLDDGLYDYEGPLHSIDCTDEVLREAPAAGTRQLGTWHKDILTSNKMTIWPERVVCYLLARKVFDTTQNMWMRNDALAKDDPQWDDYDTHMENFFTKRLKPQLDELERETRIRFVPFDDCKTEGVPVGACNACEHAVIIDAPLDSKECLSSVGFSVPSKHSTLTLLFKTVWSFATQSKTKLSSAQILVYGSGTVKYDATTDVTRYMPPFCHWELNIAHELGHTVGLLHDHQREERRKKAIVNIKKADKFSPLRSMKLMQLKALADQYKDHERLPPDAVQKWLKLDKEIRVLDGEIERVEHNYGIESSFTGGSYDINSVMHYVDFHGFCIPHKALKPEDFCDIGEDPSITGCTPGTEEHCDRGASAIQWPKERNHKGFTDKDYDAIKDLYKGIISVTV